MNVGDIVVRYQPGQATRYIISQLYGNTGNPSVVLRGTKWGHHIVAVAKIATDGKPRRKGWVLSP